MVKSKNKLYEPTGPRAKGGTVEILPDGTEKVYYARGRNPNSLKNLKTIPKGTPLSPEKAKELQKRSQEARSRNKKLRTDLEIMLAKTLKDGEITHPEDLTCLSKSELQDNSNLNAQGVIAARLVKLATGGNLKAVQMIYDYLGQTPLPPVDDAKSSTIRDLTQAIRSASKTNEEFEEKP